ncbi:glycine-rich domain-containing protein [Actinomadura decatromicini]|uniref:Uncharacterized protein n=1 Tax=Actinomadura decatromicini TaxID=2604572 RepID=A0A5D3F4R3_9ACTN|nr:hypothetical protein [Actinomadura decatromicini]TYK43281.1 hypothetical protein FXF68_39395 [Actinomadura decatromicini]
MITTEDRTADAATGAIDPRKLLDAETFESLVRDLVEEEHENLEAATRIVGQTLVFLRACADSPGAMLSPSKRVDKGWHRFILRTHLYAEFCERVAGRFLHHDPVCTADIQSGAALARTVAALHATGFHVDDELWDVSGDCSQCHAKCYDSP